MLPVSARLFLIGRGLASVVSCDVTAELLALVHGLPSGSAPSVSLVVAVGSSWFLSSSMALVTMEVGC